MAYKKYPDIVFFIIVNIICGVIIKMLSVTFHLIQYVNVGTHIFFFIQYLVLRF